MKNPDDAAKVNRIINDPKLAADMKSKGHVEVTTESGEMKEDDDTDLLQQDLTQKMSGQLPPEDQSDEANDGFDDDTNPKNDNEKSIGMTESKKKKLKEDKNKVSLFLENQIMKIVEKNIPPRITKADLVKYLSEAGPAVAPTKPKPTTKPGTKPTTRPKPKHPGQNPNPGTNPAPKAISPEKAKESVIDLIINLLEK